MKKKSIIIISIVVVLAILLFPIPSKLKDGGTVEYRALLYTITDYHKLILETDESESGYIEGIKIEILGIEIFNSLDEKESFAKTEERVKLADVKIETKEINTKKLVKFNGTLYGKSNALIDYAGDFSKSVGKINFLINEEYMPQLDGETNCKELVNCDVLEYNEKSMVLNVNNVAVLFSAISKENIKKTNGKPLNISSDLGYSSFVGTVLEEKTNYMIVEPNEDEDERKSSDKIKINYGADNVDHLYGIGRKVVVYYTGYIMESYPAQINTNKIDVDGYKDFEITVKKSTDISKKKIINNKDLASDGKDFNLYYYGLDEVNVKVDNKEMSLEKALKSGKITLNGIVEKANTDIQDATIYKDGGSLEYHYKDYTIIKVHKEDGNRDVYIGIPEMELNDLKLQYKFYE